MRAPADPDARRAAILDAALDLIALEGPAKVTHRAVAARAGVPLAATTYYFGSKDEILLAALELVAEREAAALTAARGLLGDGVPDPGDVARALVATLAAEPHLAAKFELYLAAGRRPELRAVARRSVAAFVELAASVVPPQHASTFVACVDGLVLRHGATSGALDTDELAEQIATLIAALRRRPGDRATT